MGVIQSDSNIDLSIWVISYNHAPYIKEAIDSILAQKTEYTYELLITDDASNDGTSEIILEYAKKYPDKIKAFMNDKNCGNPRQILIENKASVRGNYWCILESDDFWISDDKIEKQLDFLYSHPGYIGSSHAFLLKNEISGTETIEKMSLTEWDIYERLRNMHTPTQLLYCHASSYIWKNVFLHDKKGWFKFLKDKQTFGDDLVASRMMSYGGKIRCFEEVMSCYRLTGKGVWSSLSEVERAKHNCPLNLTKKVLKAVFLRQRIFFYSILIREWYKDTLCGSCAALFTRFRKIIVRTLSGR